MLIEQLNTDHTVFDETSRAQLIDDSFNLGRAGMIDQIKFLEIVSYLSKDNSPIPFFAAFQGLNYIEKMLVNKFQEFEMFKAII